MRCHVIYSVGFTKARECPVSGISLCYHIPREHVHNTTATVLGSGHGVVHDTLRRPACLTLSPRYRIRAGGSSGLCRTDTFRVAAHGYRYGFNGKEADIEWGDDSYDFGARIYDARVGRWLSVDPLAAKYPGISPYAGMKNSPILFIDPDGKDVFVGIYEKTESGYELVIYPLDADQVVVNQVRSALQYLMSGEDKPGILTKMIESRKANFLLIPDPPPSLGKSQGTDYIVMDNTIYLGIYTTIKEARINLDASGKPISSHSPAASSIIHESGHNWHEYLSIYESTPYKYTN